MIGRISGGAYHDRYKQTRRHTHRSGRCAGSAGRRPGVLPPEIFAQSASLTATVNNDKSVDLNLSNGPTNWWFRIETWGACTAATGTSYDNIRGYQPGTYNVWAYSDSNCGAFVASASFTISDPTLTATVNNDRSVTLTLSHGPNDWSFRIDAHGSCTPATGTTVSNIRGYQAGLHYVGSFSGSDCGSFNGLAGTTFTIPDATLTTTVNGDRSVDLTLTNGPTNWWFRINHWGTCTAASGTSYDNIRGYRSGTHVVAVFPNSNCGSHGAIAGDTFFIPTATLTATVKDDQAFDLTLANGPTNWWFRIDLIGTCTPASGTTFSDIRGYGLGEHVVWAYTGGGCNYPVASLTFELTDKPAQPAAPALTPGNAQITASWTAPGAGSSAITDYDVRYRATGTTGWGSAAISAVTYNPGEVGDGRTSNGQTGQALDLGTVSLTGLTVAKVTDGGISNVYRITEPVSVLRIKLYGRNVNPGPTMFYEARYATTAPTTGNMNSHGSRLWRNGVTNYQYVTGDATALYLPANTYFWVTMTTSGTTDDVTPTVQADPHTVPSPLSVAVAGLTNGTEYEVQVRAANAKGTGAWSTSATLKAGLPAQPSTPTIAAGDNEITVTWTAPANNGSTITDYDVRYSSDSGANWTETDDTTDSTATTATITGLSNSSSYIAQVRATNSVGDSLWSPSSASVSPAPAPAAPSAPTLAAGARQLTATWTAPNANGLTITDYDVQYRKSSETDWTDWTHTGAALTATLTGLDGAVTYEVRVRAESSAGEGAWSPSASLQTNVGVPDAPATPSLTSSSSTQITVQWATPYNGGSALSGFKVQYKASSSSDWTSHTFSSTGTTTSATIGSLTNGASYDVQVRATNAQGDSPWSATATSAVGSPSRVTATVAPGDTQLVVSWTAPANNGNAIDDYDVRYRQAGTSSWTQIYDGGSVGQAHVSGSDEASSTNPINFGNLGAGITREALGSHQGLYKTANAIDEIRLYLQANGGSAFTARASATKPTTTTTLSTGAVLASSATTTPNNRFTEWVGPIAANGYFWASPTDGNSTSYGTRFRQIYHIDLATTATTYTITGLTNGTEYEVQVRAGNAIGNGQWSAAVSETPMQPNLKATGVTNVGATLTIGNHTGNWWYKATGGGGPHTSCSSAVTTTTGTLTGLTGSTAYTYTAYTDSGCATVHGTATFTTLAPVAPDALAAPTLTPGNAQVTAAWTAPSSDGGSAITDYDMRYRTVGTTGWTHHFFDEATYSNSNLSSDGSTGQALNLGTVSLSGLTVTKVTTGGISNVYKISQAVGGLRLMANALSTSQDNSAKTYQARYALTAPTTSNMNTHGSRLWEISNVNSGSYFTGHGWTGALPANAHFWVTSTTAAINHTVRPTIEADKVLIPSPLSDAITGLTNGTNYEVQARADNAVGTTAWSASALVVAGTPVAPTVAASGGDLAVSWTAPSSDNGSAITDYDVRYSSDNGATWTEMTDTTSTSTIAAISDLASGGYLVQVRAGNTHGDGPWSASGTATVQ